MNFALTRKVQRFWKAYPLLLIIELFFLATAVVSGESESDLKTISNFQLPYDQLGGDNDYETPVMSLSQRFINLDAGAWVQTAIPMMPPELRRWDVRAVKFDMVVGRREVGSTHPFAFKWDGSSFLKNQKWVEGASLHAYTDCSGDDAVTQPCQEPTHIFQVKLSDSSVETSHRGSWGNVYGVDAFLSRDPETEGWVISDNQKWWISLFLLMPDRYTEIDSNGRRTEYEVRAFLPVWDGESEAKDLAIKDHANLLGYGENKWKHGHELSDSIYDGMAYPTPGYQAVGYETTIAQPTIPSPSTNQTEPTVGTNQSHHWPNGVPPPSPSDSSPPPSGISSVLGQLSGVEVVLISIGIGLLFVVVIVISMLINGCIRRRRILRERLKNSDSYELGVSEERERLVLDGDDGSYVYESEGRSRNGTHESSGSPMNSGENTGREIMARGLLTNEDDEEDDFSQ